MLRGTDYYFAYGVHMVELAKLCPGVVALGVGWAHHHRLAFAGHSSKWGGGLATALHSPHSIVLGRLYLVTPEQLKGIDELEGAAYERRALRVNQNSGGRKRMFCHQLLDTKLESDPSPTYLEGLRQAHASLGYDLRVPGYQSTKIPRSSPHAPDTPRAV